MPQCGSHWASRREGDASPRHCGTCGGTSDQDQGSRSCRQPYLRTLQGPCVHPQRPRTCVVPVPIRAMTTSWLFAWSVTLIPCRTWMCFSRMSRLLKVRLPSVQYLRGQSREALRRCSAARSRAPALLQHDCARVEPWLP